MKKMHQISKLEFITTRICNLFRAQEVNKRVLVNFKEILNLKRTKKRIILQMMRLKNKLNKIKIFCKIQKSKKKVRI
jgi:hypothetical protein